MVYTCKVCDLLYVSNTNTNCKVCGATKETADPETIKRICESHRNANKETS